MPSPGGVGSRARCASQPPMPHAWRAEHRPADGRGAREDRRGPAGEVAAGCVAILEVSMMTWRRGPSGGAKHRDFAKVGLCDKWRQPRVDAPPQRTTKIRAV